MISAGKLRRVNKKYRKGGLDALWHRVPTSGASAPTVKGPTSSEMLAAIIKRDESR